MTTAAELASYASSFPSFRNRIINGNFDIWQRGESQQSSGYGSADRWQNYHSGSTKTASRGAFTVGQTEVPGNPKYYLHHEVSSVTGAGNLVLLIQRIEGVQTLAGQTVTLSFWAKADSNKNIATEFLQNFGSGGSPSAAVTTIGVTTHNLTTSWQKFTATVSIPFISGKTIGSDNNDYISFAFWFDAGSDYNSRTNSLGQQSGTFDIAQVQLEEGTVATPFEHRPIGTELALCQRYFEKSYDINTAPGNSTQENSFRTIAPRTLSSAADYMYSVQYKVTKRSGTDLVIYSIDGTQGSVRDISGGTNTTLRSSLGGASNLMINFDIIDTRFYAFHWTATAEL
jgi:hypothetical protein